MKTILVLIIVTFSLLSCKSNPVTSKDNNGFSFHLTIDDPDNHPDSVPLEKLVLEYEPILSYKQIESYEWNSHKIIYSDEAQEEIIKKGSILGRNFVVIAENQRIYWGRFMNNSFSSTCQNPVIVLHDHLVLESTNTNNFVIDRAYPSYFADTNSTDLRNDIRIYNALNYSNKLK